MFACTFGIFKTEIQCDYSGLDVLTDESKIIISCCSVRISDYTYSLFLLK